MIIVRGMDLKDLRRQLTMPQTNEEEKPSDEYFNIKATENPDEIVLWVPTRYKGKNVLILYEDVIKEEN